MKVPMSEEQEQEAREALVKAARRLEELERDQAMMKDRHKMARDQLKAEINGVRLDLRRAARQLSEGYIEVDDQLQIEIPMPAPAKRERKVRAGASGTEVTRMARESVGDYDEANEEL